VLAEKRRRRRRKERRGGRGDKSMSTKRKGSVNNTHITTHQVVEAVGA